MLMVPFRSAVTNPVLLTDADGICGVCGPNEVIRALAISKSARDSAVPA